MNLQIIHEDKDIIVCYKPAGVATQTKRLGQQDMESVLKNYRAKKGESPYIGVVHRLDQPVEGVMVFAKNQKAAANLSKQIQQHIIGKHYYAVSAFAPEKAEGVLENYLLTDKKTNHTVVVDGPERDVADGESQGTDLANRFERELPKGTRELEQDAKYAKLEYRVVESGEAGILFDIKLHTGRQHQIRVQMAHMGCPLIGDSKYGQVSGDCVAIGTSKQSCKRNANGDVVMAGESLDTRKMAKQQLALCSYRLCFAHPVTGKQMDFSIKPQGDVFAGGFHGCI